LNFKVIVERHTGFWVFVCVRDAAATRGQYLALNKA